MADNHGELVVGPFTGDQLCDEMRKVGGFCEKWADFMPTLLRCVSAVYGYGLCNIDGEKVVQLAISRCGTDRVCLTAAFGENMQMYAAMYFEETGTRVVTDWHPVSAADQFIKAFLSLASLYECYINRRGVNVTTAGEN